MTADNIGEDEGGFDYGWPETNVALADPTFIELLTSAEVNAVAYAMARGSGEAAVPVLLLAGVSEAPLREAFALFARWQFMSGPGAVRVEIAFDGAGFRIAMRPDARALAWRCCGFENIAQPEVINLAWVKAIDTRNELYEALADYGQNLFAPVYLGAAIVRTEGDGQSRADELADVPRLLLPAVEIYRCADDIPAGSCLISAAPESAPATACCEPISVAALRGWRLPSIMPKTIHVLRHTGPGRSLVDRLLEEGVARWQAEQAIANLRLAALADIGEAPPQSHWRETHSLRLGHIELADQPVDLNELALTDILDQVRRDALFLLRRIGKVPAEPTLAGSQAALREAGFA